MKLMTGLIAIPVVALSAFMQPAHGQQATPEAAAPVAIPAPACEKPSDFTPTFESKEQVARFQKRLDVYKGCINGYARANSNQANDLIAQARAHTEAANKAITDFNAYMTDLNRQSQSADDKSGPVQTQNIPKVNQ